MTDYLLDLLQYLLQQALKYGVPLPILTTTEEPIDPLQYLNVNNEKAIGEILTQTISACKHCLLVMARAVDPDSPFYDILESVIYLQEDSEDLLKKEFPEEARRLKLPAKQVKLFQSKSMLDKRMDELNRYLELVLADPKMRESEDVSRFLKENFVNIDQY